MELVFTSVAWIERTRFAAEPMLTILLCDGSKSRYFLAAVWGTNAHEGVNVVSDCPGYVPTARLEVSVQTTLFVITVFTNALLYMRPCWPKLKTESVAGVMLLWAMMS